MINKRNIYIYSWHSGGRYGCATALAPLCRRVRCARGGVLAGAAGAPLPWRCHCPGGHLLAVRTSRCAGLACWRALALVAAGGSFGGSVEHTRKKGCLYLQKPAERFFTAGVALVCVCVSSAAAASLLHLRRDGAAGPRGVKAGDD